jgi:DNA-damage-inducible protein D
MSNQPTPISPFEQIRETDTDGQHVWAARKLMSLLGYPRWSDFKPVIDRAMEDCTKSGRTIEEHFRNIPEKSSGGRPGKDYYLTRYACRLAVMNSRARDDTKGIAAHARTYFSDKVEEAEQTDQSKASIEQVIREAKLRVDTREKLAGSYDQLEEIAQEQGMVKARDFERMHGEGHRGMFGMPIGNVAEKHNLTPQPGKKKININDHFGTTNMGAIIVRNAIAGADISNMDDPSNPQMFQANRAAGEQIRDLLMSHGIVPEELPMEPHISIARQIADGQIPLDMIPTEEEPEQIEEPKEEKE